MYTHVVIRTSLEERKVSKFFVTVRASWSRSSVKVRNMGST